jgi:hypothetical protein
MPTSLQRSAPIATLLVILSCTGCGSSTPPLPSASGTSTGSAPQDTGKLPSDAELLQQLDDALDFTLEKRRLDVKDQAAWQIIHGALAYKRKFLVRAEGKDVSAVEYALGGGPMKGWNLVEADVLDEKTGRRGVRAQVEGGTLSGQGHYDQWMGYLSDTGLQLDEKVMVEGKEHTIADYIRQIELDVPRNMDREYSWTIMALTAYHPTDYQWTASDGKQWSLPQLVEAELEFNIDDSPCGGTHRMYGLTLVRNRHLAAGGKLEGVWRKCEEKIQEQIERAKASLNADGSLSAKYFQHPATAPDITEWMASSGHVFEFLAEALNKEQLEEPWMKRAAWKLCEQFRKTKAVDVECARLFHATHGLVLYREKVFGAREYPGSSSHTP